MKNSTFLAIGSTALTALIVGCSHDRADVMRHDRGVVAARKHVVVPPNGYPLGGMDTDSSYPERVGMPIQRGDESYARTDVEKRDDIQYREAAPSDRVDERVVISEEHRIPRHNQARVHRDQRNENMGSTGTHTNSASGSASGSTGSDASSSEATGTVASTHKTSKVKKVWNRHKNDGSNETAGTAVGAGTMAGSRDTVKGEPRANTAEGTTNTATAKKAAAIKRMDWENSEIVKRMSDVEALNRLWHLNQSEIAMADLAESKAKSEALIANARQVKADQQKRADEIKALADKRKIKLESFQPATYEVAVKNQLDGLDAADFDTGYHAALTRAHQEANHDLQVARKEVRDSEILGLIRKNMSSLTAKVALPVRNQEAKERASAE